MKRLVVFALAMSLGQSSVAIAGETLLESARRVTRQITESQPAKPTPPAKKVIGTKPIVQPYAALQGQVSDPSLEGSGMRKRTKWMIAMGAIIGFAGVVYAIDHGVEDFTPSTLGTREDGL
jgi:hypothetical protein